MDQQTLKEWLHYDPESGVFTWLQGRRVGQQAGTLCKSGYVQINLLYVSYAAHRLAFLYMVGRWPVEIDHKDLDKSNNKWDNLREATKSQNQGNRRAVGQFGKGVTYDKSRNKFIAQYKRKNLGRFATAEEAHAAYCVAAEAALGEFFRKE